MIEPVARALQVAMVDVGGTLWPNSWPLRETDGAGRVHRVAAAMPAVDSAVVEALVADLTRSSRHIDPAWEAVSPDSGTLVATCLDRQGLPRDQQTVMLIRRAMAVPVFDRLKPLPGAPELLAAIHELGMRTVITSNTYWRDAESYWDDFRLLGMAEHIDEVVTSVDAGRLKPHPAVFELAMQRADVPAERCAVIGNSEVNDVEPALKLGMLAILVHPDDPRPESSRAHAIAPDLWACAEALRTMLQSS
jgi:FMN phosphatase YigB (HAD superfamily)